MQVLPFAAIDNVVDQLVFTNSGVEKCIPKSKFKNLFVFNYSGQICSVILLGSDLSDVATKNECILI